jgi:hypothetical protein
VCAFVTTPQLERRPPIAIDRDRLGADIRVGRTAEGHHASTGACAVPGDDRVVGREDRDAVVGQRVNRFGRGLDDRLP